MTTASVIAGTDKDRAQAWFEALRDELCLAFARLEEDLPPAAPFAEQAAGRFERGLPLLEAMLKGYTAKCGPSSPLTLAAMNNVGCAHEAAGDMEKAVQLFEAAAEILARAAGPPPTR